MKFRVFRDFFESNFGYINFSEVNFSEGNLSEVKINFSEVKVDFSEVKPSTFTSEKLIYLILVSESNFGRRSPRL